MSILKINGIAVNEDRTHKGFEVQIDDGLSGGGYIELTPDTDLNTIINPGMYIGLTNSNVNVNQPGGAKDSGTNFITFIVNLYPPDVDNRYLQEYIPILLRSSGVYGYPRRWARRYTPDTTPQWDTWIQAS